MQTFLPYNSFKKSARCLDNKRLFKQLVEAKQILCSLRYTFCNEDWKKTKSWENRAFNNHPAVKMWGGYEWLLAAYYNAVYVEVMKRGINTSMKPLINEYSSKKFQLQRYANKVEYPWWLGKSKFHKAMRARLYAKDPKYYRKFCRFKDFNGGKYLWPDNETKTFKVI